MPWLIKCVLTGPSGDFTDVPDTIFGGQPDIGSPGAPGTRVILTEDLRVQLPRLPPTFAALRSGAAKIARHRLGRRASDQDSECDVDCLGGDWLSVRQAGLLPRWAQWALRVRLPPPPPNPAAD